MPRLIPLLLRGAGHLLVVLAVVSLLAVCLGIDAHAGEGCASGPCAIQLDAGAAEAGGPAEECGECHCPLPVGAIPGGSCATAVASIAHELPGSRVDAIRDGISDPPDPPPVRG